MIQKDSHFLSESDGVDVPCHLSLTIQSRKICSYDKLIGHIIPYSEQWENLNYLHNNHGSRSKIVECVDFELGFYDTLFCTLYNDEYWGMRKLLIFKIIHVI